MSTTNHVEKHFTSSETVRDIVIGMADGLTVPFAQAAGLSSVIAAGSIAMGLGGYLAARSDAEHYASEQREFVEKTDAEMQEAAKILETYGLTPEQSQPIVVSLSKNPKAWIDFIMRFELGLEEPDPKRALTSALTIAGAYIAGGFIPLSAYIFVPSAVSALTISIVVTLIALSLPDKVQNLHHEVHDPLPKGRRDRCNGASGAQRRAFKVSFVVLCVPLW